MITPEELREIRLLASDFTPERDPDKEWCQTATLLILRLAAEVERLNLVADRLNSLAVNRGKELEELKNPAEKENTE